MSPGVLDVVRLWQTETPHAGALRPVAGMAARALLRENKIEKAAQLYEIASRQVPEFTSWHLEYIYFMLACRERLTKRLTEADLELAASAIRQGMFLLEHGILSTGLTERYIGRLFQLRGEWAEAIPYLLAARPHMAREDLVACDQALLISYMQTGDVDKAKDLIDDGIKNSGRFSPIYRQLRLEVDCPVQKPAPAQRLELLDGNIQNPLQQEIP
jgi:tetratricopeptide (TPR) repeat protein